MTPKKYLGPLAILLISMGLFACGGASAEGSTTTTVVASDSREASIAPIEIEEADRVSTVPLELLEPGDGERAFLRYTGEVGQEESMRMAMTMIIDLNIAGQETPQSTTSIFFSFQIHLTEMDAEGQMRRDYRVTDLRVDGEGETHDAMVQELAPIRDLIGWDVINAQGQAVASHVHMPPHSSSSAQKILEQIQDSLQQGAPVLPAEPVGVGARWRTITHVETPMVIDRIVTYTLVEREGDRIRLEVTSEAQAERQEIEIHQQGVTSELLSIEGGGVTHAEINLGRMVPESETQADMQMQMQITEGENPPVEMGLRTRMQILVGAQ